MTRTRQATPTKPEQRRYWLALKESADRGNLLAVVACLALDMADRHLQRAALRDADALHRDRVAAAGDDRHGKIMAIMDHLIELARLDPEAAAAGVIDHARLSPRDAAHAKTAGTVLDLPVATRKAE